MEVLNDIIHGDIRDVAKDLQNDSVQAIITSPPYLGLRKYGKESNEIRKEIGREKNVELYVENLVEVFEKLKPILKSDGTLWVNLGDSYIDSNLQGVPWRFALKMQDKGWILRSDIIWHKPNAMPSSVK